MWSGSNNGKLRRTMNGDTRPNYLKYGDVFMTSPRSQQRRPVNKVRPSNKMEDEKLFQRSEFCPKTHDVRMAQFPEENSFNLEEPTTFQDECEFESQSIDDEPFDDTARQNTVSNFYINRNEFNRSQTEWSRINNPKKISQQFDRTTELNCGAPTQRSIYFKKRQLPPLQRYNNSVSSEQETENYWNDFDEYSVPKKKSKYSLSFPLLWQKFIITFTSLLSIICLTWIAYNWRTTNNENSIPEIRPEKSFFKVLPDTPNVSDQNRTIYDRVSPNIHTKRCDEHLMSPSEEPGDLPMSDNFGSPTVNGRTTIPSYTIIDDRDYYVKCRKNSDVSVARQQITLIRKKLSSYSDTSILATVSCSIRKVANTQGQLGEYILIGPFNDELTARNVGKFCQIDNGEIISVQKKER